jgi:type I restriction enzyme, S subunit
MVSRDWVIVPLGKVVTLQRDHDLPNRLRRLGEVPIITSSGIGGTHSEAMVLGVAKIRPKITALGSWGSPPLPSAGTGAGSVAQ